MSQNKRIIAVDWHSNFHSVGYLSKRSAPGSQWFNSSAGTLLLVPGPIQIYLAYCNKFNTQIYTLVGIQNNIDLNLQIDTIIYCHIKHCVYKL